MKAEEGEVAVPEEPLAECDVIEVANHVHPSVKVDEGPDDGRSTEPNSVHEFVIDTELLSRCKGFEPVEGGADAAHAEVEGTDAAALVDKGVKMVLQPHRLLEGPCANGSRFTV